MCGGPGLSATYGQGQRPLHTPCASCPTTNLTVNLGSVITFTSLASSRPGASNQTDCLSQWVNYGDSWVLANGDARAFDSYPGVASVSDCLALCAAAADCEVSTYFITSKECRVRRVRVPEYRG